MFKYRELLNLDVRDLAFWSREAQKKLLLDQIKAIQAARFAMAKDAAYQEIMTDLQRKIIEVDLGPINATRENWNSLKEIGRG